MPAQSKAQQKFMGMVHAAQKGEEPASPEVAKVAKDMKPSDAKDFASTKLKGLPNHVKNEIARRLKEYAMMKPNHQTQSAAPADSLRSDDEMDVSENFPANWLQGRVSDYHTALTVKKREYDDDTNFDKEISGQPDLDEELDHNEKEMVLGVLDILKQIKDPENRKEIALKMIAKFKEEDVNFDYNKFLSSLKELNTKSLDEVGSKDWHFQAIMKLYDKAGSFTRKKIAAVITRNPNANRDKIARELRYSDYEEVTDYTDALGLKTEGVNKSKLKESLDVSNGKILYNGKLLGYYEFNRDSDSFWVDDVKNGKGQLSFDTKREVADYFKKNVRDAIKHLEKIRGKK